MKAKKVTPIGLNRWKLHLVCGHETEVSQVVQPSLHRHVRCPVCTAVAQSKAGGKKR